MVALEIRRELNKEASVDVSKTEVNRVVFHNAAFQGSNDKPPRWSLNPNLDSSSQPNLTNDLNNFQKYVQVGLPTLDATRPSGATAGPIVSPSTNSIEDRILGVLQGSRDPLPALTIAKQVGKKTASDVNRILYQLSQEGKICKITTPGISAPVWKIAGTTIFPSDDPPPMRGDRQQSANANPAQYSQAGIGGDVLYRKTESEGKITFSEVHRPADNTPNVIPVIETVGGPHSIQESSIASPSTATPQEVRPIQASEGRPSRPVQIEVDDRIQQSTDEPVTPPNRINFVGKSKEMEKNKKSKAKNIENKVIQNTMNNNEITLESPSSSRSPSAITLDSNSGGSIESVSLSSLTIEPSGSDMPPRATPSSDIPPSEATPSSAGGPRASKAKKKMAIRFPGKPKDEDSHTSQ